MPKLTELIAKRIADYRRYPILGTAPISIGGHRTIAKASTRQSAQDLLRFSHLLGICLAHPQDCDGAVSTALLTVSSALPDGTPAHAVPYAESNVTSGIKAKAAFCRLR